MTLNREQGCWRIRPPFNKNKAIILETLETLRFLGLLREGRLPRREPIILAGKRDSRWLVLLRASAKMSGTIYICEKFYHFAIERGLNLLQYIKITMLTLLAKEKRKMKISGASYFFENYAKKLDIISRSGSRPQFLESKVLHYDEDRKNKLNTS